MKKLLRSPLRIAALLVLIGAIAAANGFRVAALISGCLGVAIFTLALLFVASK